MAYFKEKTTGNKWRLARAKEDAAKMLKVSEPSRGTQSILDIEPAGFIFIEIDKEINNETN